MNETFAILQVAMYILGITAYILIITNYLSKSRLWVRATRRLSEMSAKGVTHDADIPERPVVKAVLVLNVFLSSSEREGLVGDLIQMYRQLILLRGKRRAGIWFYKQILGSLIPLLWRALVKIGALVWLGSVLRRFIS